MKIEKARYSYYHASTERDLYYEFGAWPQSPEDGLGSVSHYAKLHLWGACSVRIKLQ